MDNETRQGGNVAAIATMFALFFMIAFVTNFAGSMGVILKNQFQASNALSQLGNLANFFAYLFMGIPGGLILKRKGYKFTSLTAVTVGFIGVGVQLLSGYVGSFAVYVTGAFVAGFSMCMLNLVTNPLLNTLGGGGNKGNQLVQFGCSLNSVGATLSPIVLGWLIGSNVDKAQVSDAAPALMIAMGIFAVAFFVVAFSRIPEPHMETAEERSARMSGRASVLKDIGATLKFSHFTLGALAIFFYIVIEVGIPSMANLYMTEVTEVDGSQKEITVAEAHAFTAAKVAALEAQDKEIEAAEKAAEAKGESVKAARRAVEGKYVLKPGQEFQAIKKCRADGNDGSFERMSVSRVRDIVAVDSKDRYALVTCKASASYVGAVVAGVICGAYWFCMMIGRLLGGAVGSKISSRVMITCCSIVAIGLMLVTMFLPLRMVSLFGYEFPLAMCFMVVCGLCTSVMWGGIFNMAAEGLGKYVPMGSGIFMAMVFGGVLIPVQGLVADKIGILNCYWFTIALLAYVLFYSLVGSRVSKK